MTKHILFNLTETALRITPNGIHSGMDITIQNLSETANVYLGAEGVTSENFGYRLSPNQAWSVELPGRDAIYASSDVNGSSIAVLTFGLESGS